MNFPRGVKVNHSVPLLSSADRPIECSACKKSIAVVYTEVVGGVIHRTAMCSDCPELEKRLHKEPEHGEDTGGQQPVTGVKELACGVCGTTLESVRRGQPLGCSECYVVFENLILLEMSARRALPPQLSLLQRPTHLHVGRIPGGSLKFTPSSELAALHEALKDTLRREDYEQAAWLRDQIKDLTSRLDSPASRPSQEGSDRDE